MSTVIERASGSVQWFSTVSMHGGVALLVGDGHRRGRDAVEGWRAPSAARETRDPCRRRRRAGSRAGAAATNGSVELSPPASAGTTWRDAAGRDAPRARRNARTSSSPRGIFSTITVGAPIIAEGTTSASSGTSSTSTTLDRAVTPDRLLAPSACRCTGRRRRPCRGWRRRRAMSSQVLASASRRIASHLRARGRRPP